MICTMGNQAQSLIPKCQAYIPVGHSMSSEWYRFPGRHTIGKTKWLHKRTCMCPDGLQHQASRQLLSRCVVIGLGEEPRVQSCICVTKANRAILRCLAVCLVFRPLTQSAGVFLQPKDAQRQPIQPSGKIRVSPSSLAWPNGKG